MQRERGWGRGKRRLQKVVNVVFIVAVVAMVYGLSGIVLHLLTTDAEVKCSTSNVIDLNCACLQHGCKERSASIRYRT